MTAVASPRARPAVAAAAAPVAIGLGCLALVLRDWSWSSFWATVLVGVIGLGPVPAVVRRRVSLGVWLAVVGAGIAAFALVASTSRAIPVPFTVVAAITTSAAAVAEEAFFRRYAYGWLARYGSAIAITGSAIAFALVHVPFYGPAVLPIDLAAGLLFGWQRWATGGWSASSATHVAANLMQLRWLPL